MSVTSPGSRSRLARSRRWNGWTPSWALSLATPPSLKPGPSQRFRGLGKPVEGLPPVSQVPRPWVEAVQLAWAVPQAPEDSRPPPPAGVFLPLSPWDSLPHTEPDLTSTAQRPGDLSSRPPLSREPPDQTLPGPPQEAPTPSEGPQCAWQRQTELRAPISHLISVWPPAFLAICTSSFPYRSSAWALQGQCMVATSPLAPAAGPSDRRLRQSWRDPPNLCSPFTFSPRPFSK